MSGIFGLLNLADSERVFISTLGQSVIYDAIQTLMDRWNQELTQAMSVFLEETTEDHKQRYKLPGGGRLQERGQASPAPNAAVKAYSGWDVAYPLKDFGAEVAADRISYAYMTVQDLNRHLDTVTFQDINTVRFQMLYALFNNTERSFADPLWGTLLVEPAANNDSVAYPPKIGTEIDLTPHNHYLASGYATGSISDTNDPFITLTNHLEEHFGTPTGGSNIVVFCNLAEQTILENLTLFHSYYGEYLQPGVTVTLPANLPPNVPGRIVGRHMHGAFLSRWDWIPSGYLLAVHLDVPKPLKQRVDLAATGLPRGLNLVAQDSEFPIQSSDWSHRFGFGVGNRLNAVVMQLTTNGSYGIPTAFA